MSVNARLGFNSPPALCWGPPRTGDGGGALFFALFMTSLGLNTRSHGFSYHADDIQLYLKFFLDKPSVPHKDLKVSLRHIRMDAGPPAPT